MIWLYGRTLFALSLTQTVMYIGRNKIKDLIEDLKDKLAVVQGVVLVRLSERCHPRLCKQNKLSGVTRPRDQSIVDCLFGELSRQQRRGNYPA